MAFSASKAALEGFRLVGRRPVSFLVWSLIYGAYMALLVGEMRSVYGGAMSDYYAAALSTPQSLPGAMLTLIGRLMTPVLVSLPGSLLVSALLQCAIWRAVLTPARRGFAYLRIGGAELRMLVVYVLFTIGTLAVYAAAAGGVFLVVRAGLDVGVKVLASVLICVLALVVLFCGYVRLVLTGPNVVATGRIDLAAAWRLSRGRFWPMLGMILLALVLAMAVSGLGQAGLQPFLGTTIVPRHVDPTMSLVDVIKTDPMTYGTLGLLAMLGYGLMLVVIGAPYAAAYRDIAAEA